MHRIIMTLLAVLLGGSTTALAAKKNPAGGKKADPRYGAPTATSVVDLKAGAPADEVRKAYAAALAGFLPKLGTDDLANFQAFEATIHRAARPGAETERAACAGAISAALKTPLSVEAKALLLQQLANVGGAESVEAETALLGDAEPRLRESARCALQHNPAPAAGAALRVALERADDPAWKAALALALAARQDAAAVPAIAAMLKDAKDAAAVRIALDALAEIGNSDALHALSDARAALPEALRPAAADAQLKAADRQVREGKASSAAALYRELAQPSQPRPIRFAALNALLAEQGDAAVPQLLELLAGADADGKAIALGRIRALEPAGRKALAAGLGKLPGDVQATVLGVLANLGEKAVLPEILKAAQSGDAAHRTTALAALGRLGDASSVTVISGALAKAQDAAERAQLEQVLVDLGGGNETDQALLAALAGAAGDSKRSFMSVLAKRNSRAALPALLAAADDADAAMARAAFQALGSLASDGDAPALLGKVATLTVAAARGEAENAAAKALAKIGKPAERTAAVEAALGKSTDVEVRRSMLRLMAACADRKALGLVEAALKDPEPRVRDAAIRSLADWTDITAWDALEGVFARPEKEYFRVLALRGMVKLLQAENKHPKPALFERYRQLLAGARDDNDRRAILGVLSGAGDPAALELALPLLAQPGVRAEAELAVKNIATAIQSAHPDAARAALKQLKK